MKSGQLQVFYNGLKRAAECLNFSP